MKRRTAATLVFSSAGMLVLILDGKAALLGAQAGVELCLNTVIPSLFPFFVLSVLLTQSILGQTMALLRPIGALCRIPRGAESLLLVGLVGGYPVGAQNVSRACSTGCLSPSDGSRMIVFCNNAGPAFLFGILSPLFSNRLIPWLLWGIHILSALTVGVLLPGSRSSVSVKRNTGRITLPGAVEKAVKSMALVCGWIVLFRMLLSVLERWLLWSVPQPVRIAVAGILELSNGCILLSRLSSEGMRFLFAAVFLSFGGVCVTMQTISIAGGLSMRLYYPGKLLQALISFLLAAGCQSLFPANMRCDVPVPIVAACLLLSVGCAAYMNLKKKCSSFPAASGV